MTVFKHFPRKEDLLLDREVDAVELLRPAVRDRAPGVDVLASLREVAFRLVDARHALSGVKEGSIPFFRTVAESPALLAAFFVAGYDTVLVGTARRLMAGEPADAVADGHRAPGAAIRRPPRRSRPRAREGIEPVPRYRKPFRIRLLR